VTLLSKLPLVLNAIVLAFGGFVAVIALVQTWSLVGAEPVGFGLRRGIPAAALLLLTTAYSWILWRRGFLLESAVSYLVSYLSLGLVLAFLVTQMTKGFAPSPPDEASRAWVVSWVVIGLLCTAVSYQVWRVGRRTRR
jgi:hypothetical protein